MTEKKEFVCTDCSNRCKVYMKSKPLFCPQNGNLKVWKSREYLRKNEVKKE